MYCIALYISLYCIVLYYSPTIFIQVPKKKKKKFSKTANHRVFFIANHWEDGNTNSERKSSYKARVTKDILRITKVNVLHYRQLFNQEEPTNKEDIDEFEDIDPQEVEKPDIQDVEISIERLKTRKALVLDNTPLELV